MNGRSPYVVAAISLTLLSHALVSCEGDRGTSPRDEVLVAIDIGHSSRDPGAISARGRSEFSFNHRLAHELRDALIANGFRCLLVNDSGDLHGDSSLRERTRLANEARADLFISIHHDSVQGRYLREWVSDGKPREYCDEFSGYSIFYSEMNGQAKRSRKLAEVLADELLQSSFKPSLHHAIDIEGERRDLVDRQRGIYRVDFWVVKAASMPAVLLEAGVIVNRGEEALLAGPDYRRTMVQAVVRAIGGFSHGAR